MKQLLGFGLAVWATASLADTTYTAADFVSARKFDSHVHANVDDHQFLDIAKKDGFELL